MNKKNMVKIAGIVVALIIATSASIVVADNENNGHGESSPNSGDGIPDGSDYDSPHGPNGDGDTGNGHNDPAPNSGDGNPDGPGW